MDQEMKKQYEFVMEEDQENRLVFLGSKGDISRMNWVQGSQKWGTVICPDSLDVKTKRELLENGRLRESYQFTNKTDFPVFLKETDLGIYVTFNDNYETARECLERRCHTHLFCGGEASYVQAFRMGGRAPHLGLQLSAGYIASYSVERDEEKRSDDRGDFILHPVFPAIEPKETVEIVWELFWFEDQADFEKKLLERPGFPVIKAENFTFFPQENMTFEIRTGKALKAEDIHVVCEGKEMSCVLENDENGGLVKVSGDGAEEGEYRFDIDIGGKKTYALLYRCPELEKMVERRCRFIVERQQYTAPESHLHGAYLIYDNEEGHVYYSHLDDHNGGRERLGMGVLLALYLREHADKELYESLMLYQEYVYRELYDRDTGTVFNDICHNNDWNRLYNYPWMAVFQLELYYVTGERDYIADAYCTMKKYYETGGEEFYAIGIPMTELLCVLEKEGLEEEKAFLEKKFLEHAEVIRRRGTDYPASEVQYEQSIAAPAVSILLQAEEITGTGKYLEEAQRQLDILELFNGGQPDYHQYGNAVRHWDGYWFGKNRMYGDTFPHYWSVLSGAAYVQMYEIKKNPEDRKKAAASFRGSLNLFKKDGFASCAMVFPKQVNGKKAAGYDPWANDQDWALYYALKYRKVTEEG